MKSSSIAVMGLSAALLGCVLSLAEGCASQNVEQASRLGRLEMSLRATSSSGLTYRLAGAIFHISGTSESYLSTEADPAANTLGADLEAGDYLIELVEGWHLDRLAADGTYSSVAAMLTSKNPLGFTIRRDETTSVQFRFSARDDLVEFGTGRVAVDIAVDDSPADAGAGGPMVTETLAIVSDTSWRVWGAGPGQFPPTGWNSLGFDDASWGAPVSPNPGSCRPWSPTQSWERPAQSMWDPSDSYSAFFRKVVTLPSNATVKYAKITAYVDDDVAIWVNGTEVFRDSDFGAGSPIIIEENPIELTPLFAPGANLIAIHVQDTVGVCRSAYISGILEMTHPAP